VANFDNIGEFALDQVLAKRLTTPGGAVAPTVAPELFANITLENDRPEWGWMKNERLGARTVLRTAGGAGVFNFVQCYLPTTSREIAVVTLVRTLDAQAAQLCRITGIGGGLGGWGAQQVAARDFRWLADRTSLIIEHNTGVALPTRGPDFGRLNSIGMSYEEAIVIAPGTGLLVYGPTANTTLSFDIAWRERGAQPGELI